MKDRLTEEEVLHVAHLARIEISKEELEMYQVKLKKLLDQVSEIENIDGYDDDYLIAPWHHDADFREDVAKDMLDPKEALKNSPRKSGNYIEVPVVISNE